MIGALASLVGLVLGLGLFKALEALFTGLPQAGTVFSAQTVVVTIALGTGITLLAGLFPALRATRVHPSPPCGKAPRFRSDASTGTSPTSPAP